MTKPICEDFLTLPSSEFIISVLPISYFKLDLEKNVFAFDKNFGPMLGMPGISQMTLDEFYAKISATDQNQISIMLLAITQGYSKVLGRRFQFQDADGCQKWLEWSSVLDVDASDANSSGKKLSGIFRELSENKFGQSDLLQSERWFMEVLEESPHALYRVDIRNNRFDYVSKGFANALGLTREEVLAIPYSEFSLKIHPVDIERIVQERDELFKSYKGGRLNMHVEFRYMHKNGEYIWLNDTFSTVPGPDGQLAYQVGFGAVIEEQKHLEEQLQQSNDLLEEKVQKRTTELRQANTSLTAMMSERQELEKKLLEISERERRFIGRELHDGLCQQIVGVMCMFEALRTRLGVKKIAEESELIMIRDFLQDAVMQIRTLSRGLCPLALDPNAVGAALSTLAIQTSVLYKVECLFSGSVDTSVADADAALHLYRITQEAIQNGIRHGGARQILIDLTSDNKNICIQIANNGMPLGHASNKPATKSVAEAGSGLGLKLIDYRVGLLGGTWNIENQQHDAGVRLTISAPIYGGALNETIV